MSAKETILQQIRWINYFFVFAGCAEIVLLSTIGISIVQFIMGPVTIVLALLSIITATYSSRLLLGIWTVVKFNPVLFFVMIALISLLIRPYAENLSLYFLQLGLLIALGMISLFLGIVLLAHSRKIRKMEASN